MKVYDYHLCMDDSKKLKEIISNTKDLNLIKSSISNRKFHESIALNKNSTFEILDALIDLKPSAKCIKALCMNKNLSYKSILLLYELHPYIIVVHEKCPGYLIDRWFDEYQKTSHHLHDNYINDIIYHNNLEIKTIIKMIKNNTCIRNYILNNIFTFNKCCLFPKYIIQYVLLLCRLELG